MTILWKCDSLKVVRDSQWKCDSLRVVRDCPVKVWLLESCTCLSCDCVAPWKLYVTILWKCGSLRVVLDWSVNVWLLESCTWLSCECVTPWELYVTVLWKCDFSRVVRDCPVKMWSLESCTWLSSESGTPWELCGTGARYRFMNYVCLSSELMTHWAVCDYCPVSVTACRIVRDCISVQRRRAVLSVLCSSCLAMSHPALAVMKGKLQVAARLCWPPRSSPRSPDVFCVRLYYNDVWIN